MPSPLRALVFTALVALPVAAVALLSLLAPPPPSSAASTTPPSLSLARLTAIASTRTPQPSAVAAGRTPTTAATAASADALTPVPTVTPAPGAATPTAPPAATPAAAAAPTGKLQIANSDGMGVNLRADPGSGGAILRLLEPGTTVTAAGEDRQVGDATWRKVTDPEGNTGWVAADLLSPAP